MTTQPAPFTLLDLVRLLRRRWQVAAATAIAVVVIAALLVTRSEPLYQAAAKLALDTASRAVDFDADPDRRAAIDSVLSTQRELLLSRAVAERAVRGGSLLASPRYTAAADPAALLAQRLRAQVVRNALVLAVTVDDEDPSRAEAALEAVLAGFFAEAAQRAHERGAADCAFLEGQLAEADTRLVQAREREKAVRSAHGIIGEDPEASPHARALAELAPRLVDARAKVAAATAQVQQVAAAQAKGEAAARRQALVEIPRIAADPLIQRLRGRLSELRTEHAALARSLLPRHPRMIAMAEQVAAQEAELDAALAAAAAGAAAERAAAEEQAAALHLAASQEQAALAAYREAVIELRRLAEERRSQEAVRDKLAQRLDQRRVELRMEERQMTVVDPPAAEAGPQLAGRVRGLAVSLVLAVAAAIAMALAADLLDRRLRGAQDVAGILGAPVLVRLPMPAETGEDPPGMVEAVRDLRTGLRHHVPADASGARVVVLAGAGPDLPALAVAWRAAMAFADAGEQVLLVDADLRRVGPGPEAPGLAQLLAGEPGIAAAPSGHPGLDHLGNGGGQANPAELLHSHCLPEWLAQERGRYGLVLIAGPGLSACGDAALLAEHADGLVLVAAEARTTSDELRAAAARLDGVRGRLAGVVLMAPARPAAG